jgi:hypothetical protein
MDGIPKYGRKKQYYLESVNEIRLNGTNVHFQVVQRKE